MQGQQLPTPEFAHSLQHKYDELGDRIATLLPNGRELKTLRYGSGHWHGLAWNNRSLASLERDSLHRESKRHLGTDRNAKLTAERQYDPQSRLISLSLHRTTANSQQQLQHRRYHWNQSGELEKIHDAERGVTQYQYDPLGQLLRANHPEQEEVFAFDPAGNILSGDDSTDKENDKKASRSIQNQNQNQNDDKSQNHPAPSKATDRYTEEQPAPGFRPGVRPSLGKVTGNLLARYFQSQGLTNQNDDWAYEKQAYDYDIQGNTVVKTQIIAQPTINAANDEVSLQCEYDSQNQLIKTTKIFSDPKLEQYQQVTHYQYDGFNRRIAKSVVTNHQASLSLFIWDGDNLLQEINPQNCTTYVYEPGSFIPLAQVISDQGIDHFKQQGRPTHLIADQRWTKVQSDQQHNGHVLAWYQQQQQEQQHLIALQERIQHSQQHSQQDKIYYYDCDHLGTPQTLVDELGNCVWSARYKAWGRIRQLDQNRIQQPLRFQGQYEDQETGFYYNRFRYYDPDIGRFITQDPIGLLGGINLYQYAANTTAWVDPLGLSSKNCGSDVAKSAGQLGREGEAAASAITGVGKNTQKFTVNGRKRIPDQVNASNISTRNPLHVTEVKNVKSQSFTRQLRDNVDLVGPGGRVDVFVRPNTKLSGPLRRANADPANPINIRPEL